MTDRQEDYINFIKMFISEKGYAPTIREINKGLNISSTSSVKAMLDRLEKEGKIKRDAKKQRAIQLVDDLDDICLKIINNYGVDNQLKKLNEEVFEFIEAIMQYEFYKYGGDIDKLKEHVIEEYGDVLFVLNQFRCYYKISNSDIRKVQQFKGERQLKRMENGE